MNRGQGATEYLVILGAVLLVALVIVSLLGAFPSMGGSNKEQQSKSYWAGTSPFAVSTVKLTGTAIVMRVRNNGVEKLQLTEIDFGDQANGTISISAPSVMINAGEEVDFTNAAFSTSNPCVGTGKTGTMYEFKNLSFVYTSGSISGFRQTGTEPFTGRCS